MLTFRNEGTTSRDSFNGCSDVDCRRLALDFKVLKPRDCMKTLK